MESTTASAHHEPWNKGKLVGQKAPFRLREIWAVRVRLQLGNRMRDLALFDLGIDSKLRACDLVKLRVRDICHGEHVVARAIVMQQKTQRPVQFEITEPTRDAILRWSKQAGLRGPHVKDINDLGNRELVIFVPMEDARILPFQSNILIFIP